MRTLLINKIIKDRSAKSYLEIGTGDASNFSRVECETKVGIDPFYEGKKEIARIDSDSFFKHNKDKFDVIFIDGLHHCEQVEKDIVNSFKFLNKGGIILIHDVKPVDEKSQRVPRESEVWTGDVWRAWLGIRKKYPKMKCGYIEERTGIATILKTGHRIKKGFSDMETTYEQYEADKGWLVK